MSTEIHNCRKGQDRRPPKAKPATPKKKPAPKPGLLARLKKTIGLP